MAQTITATDVELTKPVNAVFQQQFLLRAQQTCPYYLGSTPGQLEKRQGTSTVKWRRIEQETPTVTPLAELTATSTWQQGRDSDTPTFTDVLATVAKYGQYYICNEEVDLYLPNGTTAELVDVLAESAGRSLNQLQRDVAEDNSTQRFAGNVANTAAVNSIITAGVLDRVINELTRNAARVFYPIVAGSQNYGSAAILPSYIGLCHPDVAVDVSKIQGFTSIERYQHGVTILPGEFGYYGLAGRGVRFIQSEDASIDADAGATGGTDVRGTTPTDTDIYTLVVYGKDAIGSVGLGRKHTDGAYRAGENKDAFEMIFHEKGSAGAGDPYNEIATLAWKAFHAGVILNPNWIFGVRVGATNLSN